MASHTSCSSTEFFPEKLSWVEHTCHGDQLIDDRAPCNETAQLCENCHALKMEYGRALFERDLAQRNLQIANFWHGACLSDRERTELKVSKKTQLTKLYHYLTGADGILIREDATGNVHHESEEFRTNQLSSKSSRCKVQLEQQNDHSNSETDTAGTQFLVNGYTNHLSLNDNGYYEDSDRNQDDNELEDDNNYEKRHKNNSDGGDQKNGDCDRGFENSDDYDEEGDIVDGEDAHDGGDDYDNSDGSDDDNDHNSDVVNDDDDDDDDGDNDDDGDDNDADGDDDGNNDDDDDDNDGDDNDADDDDDNGCNDDNDYDDDEDDNDDDDDDNDNDGDDNDADDDDDGNDDDDDDVDDHDNDNNGDDNDADDNDDNGNNDDNDDDDYDDGNDDYDNDDDNDGDDDDGDDGDDGNTDDDDNDDDDGNDDGDDSDADDDDDDENDDDYNDYNDNEYVQQTSSLPADNDVSRQTTWAIKSVVKDSTVSLPVNNSRDDKVIKTKNIVNTVGNNKTGNEDLPEVGGRPFCANSVNTANVPVTNHSTNLSQGAKPKTSRHRLPLGNAAEPDYIYSSRIPSLEVTGIDHNFLARHTTDQSLQYISQPDDSNLPTELASPTSWPVWSLPPPPASEASDLRQQHPYSRGVHPAFMGNRATAPNDGQLWNQPRMERNYTNFLREEQRPFNHTISWFAQQEEAFNRSRISENPPGATGTQVGNSFNTQAWMPSAFESSWRYPAYNFNGSQTSRSSCHDFAARSEPQLTLSAVKSRAPFVLHPNVTTPATEQQSEPSNSYPSSMLQEAPLSPDSSQHGPLASGSTDDHTLASLERKVAEACAVVERVMREREDRTKARREAAQKERERRERREREAREAREREERERRERNERERREREERETREREAREISEREISEREISEREISERELREQRENGERRTREGDTAGERAPVQESSRWQCEHYQRRCSVKFPCCGMFYPCHRCHNVSGACDADDRKANHATHVKCGSCGHEEEMNEGSQYCSSCGIKMSEYFCLKCKHFTGVEKNPFHCNKCGICRIYRDKSFHCDVCNVCLDKRLEGKHKCRPDSGHDECCICLEDAFSGCQILPCSHKVHKECAIAMIQNGVRNCPICRHPLFSQDSQ